MTTSPLYAPAVTATRDCGDPSVSVVIAAYSDERWTDTVEAVDSVLRQSCPAGEVILVIDHNPALARRARHFFPGVTVVENTGARGASGARNTGVHHSRGDIVVFLDDDAVAGQDWLRLLCRHFADADITGVGGGITPVWAGGRPDWFPAEFDWVVGGSYRGMPEEAAQVRNVWTGNMAVRRHAFDTVAGFRPGFGKTGGASQPEDTDLCLRIGSAFPQGQWIYDPDAQVGHKVPPERSTRGFFLRRCWNEGRGKVALARLVGVGLGTRIERAHVARILPRALLHELLRAIRHADSASLQRSIAIIGGVLAALAGVFAEIVSRVHPPRDDRDAGFRPIRLWDWDLLQPFPAPAADTGQGTEPLRVLVRLGGEPLGFVDVDASPDHSIAEEAARVTTDTLRCEVNDCLAESGLPFVEHIPADGLGLPADALAFVADRRKLLADAPPISVVLCTRNRPEQLARCLKGFADQEYPNFDIVVVDNASTDPGAVKEAVESLDPAIPVSYCSEPRPGLSWARNTGWRTAKGDIIAFLDDDEVPDRNWLTELLRGFAAAPDVACVSGAIVPAALDTQAQLWFEEFGGHSKGRGFHQAVFLPDRPQNPLYPLPPFGTGANMAFRRSALLEIGGFNVALGAGTPTMASEDTFAFTEVLLSGHTMVYRPSALTRHYHRESDAELRRQLHGYGVGLVSYYTAVITRHPDLLPALLRLAPVAVADLFGRDSLRTAGVATLPAGMLRAEFGGMLTGLGAYRRSVKAQRRTDPGAPRPNGRLTNTP